MLDSFLHSASVMLLLSTLPLISGSECKNLENKNDTNDYLQLFYNCSNPDIFIIPDNNCAKQIFLEFSNCNSIPKGLFNYQNEMQKLVISEPASTTYYITKFASGIFLGLENLRELELRGFGDITSVDGGVLSPLRNITSLYLNGFGKTSFTLPLNALGTLLSGLSDTPLERIVMNGVRTLQHGDKRLNIADVFNIRNVNITCLIIENTYITALIGSFTDILPSLTTLSLSLSITYDIGLYSALNALFLPNIQSLNIYSNDDNAMTVFNLFEFSIFDFLNDVFGDNFDYGSFFDVNCNLNARVKIAESLTTLKLNRIQISNFTGAPPPPNYNPICFHENNQLRILDLSGCQLEQDLRVFSGLKLLTFLNVQRTKISRFSRKELEELPQLESFLLGGNNLRECIESDYDSTLFRSSHRLISLDLASCNLVNIPYYEFNSLTLLKYLNLSGNMISNVDFSLENLAQLRLLNLSNNAIERLSTNFTNMLSENFDQNSNATWLEIDLSGNPLSCLCNATDFINRIQAPSVITFTKLNSYTCLYPNGSSVNLLSVDIKQLTYQCRFIDELENNTDCPCNRDELDNLYSIRYSLIEYRCKLDGVFIQMNTLDPNATTIICSRLPQIISPVIIPVVATTGVLILISVAIIVFGVVRYKRKKPEEIRDVLKLLNAGKLISALMALLFENRASDVQTVFPYDAFVFYHDSNRCELQQEIVRRLVDMDVKIVTEAEIVLGSSRLEGVLECITQCRSIVLILSQDFLENNWCREVTIRASVRQHAVVPLVLVPFHLDVSEVIFNNLINTCRPLYWPCEIEQQEDILKELKTRIVDDTLAQVFELLESGSTNIDSALWPHVD